MSWFELHGETFMKMTVCSLLWSASLYFRILSSTSIISLCVYSIEFHVCVCVSGPCSLFNCFLWSFCLSIMYSNNCCFTLCIWHLLHVYLSRKMSTPPEFQISGLPWWVNSFRYINILLFRFRFCVFKETLSSPMLLTHFLLCCITEEHQR